MSLVLLPPVAVVCRIVSARYTRLALWATSLDKTIFNRFICINPAGEPEKALARAGAFFNELDLRCMKNEAAFSYEDSYANDGCLRHD